jgi:hypothetical protein
MRQFFRLWQIGIELKHAFDNFPCTSELTAPQYT